MKGYRRAVCFSIGILVLLLLPIYQANCQEYFQYTVQVKSDGSAMWTVTQFSGINSPADTWAGFQERVFNLVNAASSVTHRAMEIDENSLQINTIISAESKTSEYTFTWQNFAIVEGGEMLIGDVFEVNNFFGQLYGDAALELSYPSEFSIKSVYPPPYERQDTSKTLRWSRTQDIVNSKPSIILTRNGQSGNGNSLDLQQYAVTGLASAVGIGLLLLAFFKFKQHKTNKQSASLVLAEKTAIESEEDKVLNLLKSAGGSMRQSAITEQCRFSKAKTSQLLSSLEKRGNITRYKKGRDKIVTLKERAKGE